MWVDEERIKRKEGLNKNRSKWRSVVSAPWEIGVMYYVPIYIYINRNKVKLNQI